MSSSPNATAAASTGGVAILIVWLLGYLGVGISAEMGATIATVLASFTLLVGREGLKGLIGLVWKGKSDGADGP